MAIAAPHVSPSAAWMLIVPHMPRSGRGRRAYFRDSRHIPLRSPDRIGLTRKPSLLLSDEPSPIRVVDELLRGSR